MSWQERVQEDLMVMRRMAEQGGRLTMPGGHYYVLWGILVGLGFAGTYIIGAGLVPLEPWTISIVWVAVNVIGGLSTWYLSALDDGKPDAVRLTNRIVGSVWLAMGLAMGALFFGNLAFKALPYAAMAYVSPFFVGAAFMMIGALCALPWMLGVAAGWLVLGVAMMAFGLTGVTVPVYAVLFSALMVGTGLKLIAMERRLQG